MMKLIIVILFVNVMNAVRSQDCRVGGKRCGGHEQCCGGCCFDGECVDTYRSCLDTSDVCRDHSCIGEESCYSFSPPECPGCEPIPICKIL